MSKSTVEAVRRDMFGGTLASQGRAFYVTLEFLAICKGVQRLHLAEGSAEGILSRPPGGPLRYLCSGHDIARRLAHAEMTGLDGHRPSAERLAELAPAEEGTGPDEEVIRWVGTLFSDLLVARPNARLIP